MHLRQFSGFLAGTAAILLSTSAHAIPAGDVNCDGVVDIMDVQFGILLALDFPMSSTVDNDQDGVVDACPAPVTCGAGTELNAASGACVVEQAVLDAAAATAFVEGVASVDITTDNQASFDAGYASAPTPESNDSAVSEAAYAEGVASVDITTDNQVSYDAGYADAPTPESNDAEIASGAFAEGVASVDITSDNLISFAEGVASVDLTTDNPSCDWATGVWNGAACVDAADEVGGCTNSAADNFDACASKEDGSCILSGCTADGAYNYDENANSDDGSCIFLGCTDSGADNYDENANIDDDSCTYTPQYTIHYTGKNCADHGLYSVADGECIPGAESALGVDLTIAYGYWFNTLGYPPETSCVTWKPFTWAGKGFVCKDIAPVGQQCFYDGQLAYLNGGCEFGSGSHVDETDVLGPGDYFYEAGCSQSTPGWNLTTAKEHCTANEWCVGIQRNTNLNVMCAWGPATLSQYTFCGTESGVWYTNNVAQMWFKKNCID